MTSTSGTTAGTEGSKPKKEEKEPNVYQDVGEFLHCTGDVYNGGFEIKRKEHIARMLGPGVYRTNEGDTYTGNWEQDNLREAIIRFTTYANYEGPLKEWYYSGSGLYTYPDETVLEADFTENCPTGRLIVRDPNGHVWKAKADSGFAWFNPANHYYDLLEDTRVKKTKGSSTKLKFSKDKQKASKNLN